MNRLYYLLSNEWQIKTLIRTDDYKRKLIIKRGLNEESRKKYYDDDRTKIIVATTVPANTRANVYDMI